MDPFEKANNWHNIVTLFSKGTLSFIDAHLCRDTDNRRSTLRYVTLGESGVNSAWKFSNVALPNIQGRECSYQ